MLVIIGIGSSVYLAMSKTSGDKVIIEVNGELYGKYNLYEDREIEVENGKNINHVVIKDGRVNVESSSCRNQVCVDTGWIDKAGESIICLPNRVVVSIEGKGGGDYDAVSN